MITPTDFALWEDSQGILQMPKDQRSGKHLRASMFVAFYTSPLFALFEICSLSHPKTFAVRYAQDFFAFRAKVNIAFAEKTFQLPAPDQL
jgi:hypothetical protein